jgi:hypothetical protein
MKQERSSNLEMKQTNKIKPSNPAKGKKNKIKIESFN